MGPALHGFASVRGHVGTIDLLRRAVTGGRVASAYLFVGPAGVGKDRTAHALAQVMNCRDLRDGDACGACMPCRRIANGMHPDILILQRDLKDPPADAMKRDELRRRRLESFPEGDLKGNITVEQVRELLARMPFRPHEGGTRWVIVREAERMRTEAANAFLKTLEEPPEATHFVLLTHQPSSLLPTIRSRCQVVRFGLLEPAIVTAVLGDLGLDPALVETVVPLADGSVGRALEFSDAESLAHRKALMTKFLGALRATQTGFAGGAFIDIGEEAKGLDKRDLDAVLTLLLRHFRAEALKAAGADGRLATVQAARAEIVRESQSLLDGPSNLNVQLAIEAMMVKLREARP